MMVRAILLAALLTIGAASTSSAQELIPQRAFGRSWGVAGAHDWERFYHYPYVYYPQNFWGADYYRSADSLYYRYPPEMRIPVYNRRWHNYYPSDRLYHSGAHFVLDVF